MGNKKCGGGEGSSEKGNRLRLKRIQDRKREKKGEKNEIKCCQEKLKRRQ
jgi:hypothetical protein